VAGAGDVSGAFFYVANQHDGTISGYNIQGDGSLTPITGSPFATGASPVAMAADPLDEFIYVVSNTYVSGYSVPDNGILNSVTGSPFAAGVGSCSIAISPVYPFSAASAKLKIDSGASTFNLAESFTLGVNSKGIDPPNERFILRIGTYEVMLAGGSFQIKSKGRFAYTGVVNGANLSLKIAPVGTRMYTFSAAGSGVDLGSPTAPVSIGLVIGADAGVTNVARYKK
jgi:DNA-binding beta-propeller fold protein YncE